MTTHNITASGGALSGGDSLVEISITASGGALSGGESPTDSFIVANGGAVLSGQSTLTSFTSVIGTGGIVAAAEANENLGRIEFYVNNDPTKNRIFLTSATEVSLNIGATGSGEISISGEADVNFSWDIDLTFLWRSRAVIRKSATFLWNTGQLPLFWYRIEGKQNNKCAPLRPCCQKIVQNVFARTPAELCDKLRSRRFQFKIDSVQRFERPAESSQIVDDDGCNDLIPVEICEVPSCAEFCVDFDGVVFIGMDTIVQVDSFKDYETSGGFFVGGFAVVSFHINVPEFVYKADGGVSITGEYEYISSGYSFESNNGIEMGGEADISSSAWSYCGGEWPLTSGDNGAKESESLAEEITNVPWGAIDRVLTDDSLPTQVDLSFIRTSEFLIVRGFDINIPEAADVMGVKVSVSRSASQSGVRDKQVYLLVGDDIVTDNLANTGVDWPLITTDKVFGSTGLDGDSNTPWIGESSEFDELEPVDVNDPDFGFAIQIESTVSIDDTFGFVTYISLDVYYQDVGDIHILRTGGFADVISSAYRFETEGSLVLGGLYSLNAGYNYLPTGISPTLTDAFTTSGSYGLHYNYTPDSSPLILGGSAIAKPSWQLIIASGGSSVGGTSKVTPYFEETTGGSLIGGESEIDQVAEFSYESSGGLGLSGVSSPLPDYEYTTEGSVDVGGEADYKSSSYHFTSGGDSIFILGSADSQGSDLGTQEENIGVDFKILNLTFNFASEDETTEQFSAPIDVVTRCECPEMSLITEITHNISRDNRFSQFLARNNFGISRNLSMKYNLPNDSWQTNLHYRGVSSKNNNLEDWNLLFELRCTNDTAGIGIEIGRNIWQFSVQVSVEDTITGEDSDTRVLVGVIPDLLCSNGALEFKFDYDTSLDFVTIEPNGVIYTNILYDNIGLFKTRSWTSNPVLSFQISQIGIDDLTPRYDASGFGNNQPMRTV